MQDNIQNTGQKKLKFLLIEDNPTWLATLPRLLQEEQGFPGCEVVVAKDFTQAAEQLNAHKDIDYIISDYQIGDPVDNQKTVRCSEFIKKELGKRARIIKSSADPELQRIKGIFVHTSLRHMEMHENDSFSTHGNTVRNGSAGYEDFIRPGTISGINALMSTGYPIYLLEKA